MTTDNYEIVSADAEMSALREEVARLQRENDSLRRDLTIVGTKLRDEAIRRDWCGEYGEFIDDVNADTMGTWLLPCHFARTATFTTTVDYTIRNEEYVQAALESLRSMLHTVGSVEYCTVDSIVVELAEDEPTE